MTREHAEEGSEKQAPDVAGAAHEPGRVEKQIAQLRAAEVAMHRELHAPLDPASIARMTLPQRMFHAALLGMPQLGEDVLRNLLTTVAVAIPIWIASHFIGVGEIADLVGVAVAGAQAVVVATGLAELARFYNGCLNAHTEADLRSAGGHFAHAVTSIGAGKLIGVLGKISRVAGHAFGQGSLVSSIHNLMGSDSEE